MKILNHKNKKKAIGELLKADIKSQVDLMRAKRKNSKKYGIGMLENSEIINEYKNLVKGSRVKKNSNLERIIRKRAIRTMSGIAPVAVLTKPYPCPGNCAYCPSEKDVPQSYLSNEPAVMRAIRCNYNPYIQVQDRLRALVNNGHDPTKIELIIIGGTWSYLPVKYKYWYILNCFKAANDFQFKNTKSDRSFSQSRRKRRYCSSHDQTTPNPSLAKEGSTSIRYNLSQAKTQLLYQQKRNERTKYRVIGITVETRPDFVKRQELWEMRELGVTRVEIGVQAIDDEILKLNKRGHDVKEITRATKLLKDFGFKVTYHIMPGLPGSTPAKDYKMFKQLFTDERFQPDQIKFYPTVVTKGSLLYRWWKAGKYKPYSDKVLRNLIIKCKEMVPRYVRIIRLIRDIPGESIVAGNRVTNLRQVLQDKGVRCNCIRCREIGNLKFEIGNLDLKIIKYKASGGEEYFISFESKNGKTLYGFCRLRLLEQSMERRALRNTNNKAFIRELHVYGELVSPGGKNPSASSGRKRKIQHAGLGKRLLQEAEKIAKNNGFKKVAIISGVGVREYYRKQGYRLNKTYMIKLLHI